MKPRNDSTISPNLAVKEDEARRSQDKIGKRTIGGVFWLGSGSLLQAVLRILILGLLARLLLPADFGHATAALVVVGVSEMLSMLGIGSALIQLPEITEKHIRSAFTISMTMGVGLAAAMVMGADSIAAFFAMSELSSMLKVLAIIFPVSAFSHVSEKLLQRELRYRHMAVAETTAYTIGFAGTSLFLAFNGWGAWSIIWAVVAQAAVLCVIVYGMRSFPIQIGLPLRESRELLAFGGGVTAASVVNYLARQGDNIVVGRWLGADALGVYSRAYTLMNASNTLVGNVLYKVLFPAFSRIQTDRQRLRGAYEESIRIISSITIPAMTMSVLAGHEIVAVILGGGWDHAVVPFQILACGMLFRIIHKVAATVAKSCGAVYRHAWRQLVYALSIMIGALIGQRWGISGVAVSTLCALIVNAWLVMQLSIRLTDAKWLAILSCALPGLGISVLSLIPSVGILYALRDAGASPGWIVLGIVLSTALVSLAAVWLSPTSVLGKSLARRAEVSRFALGR